MWKKERLISTAIADLRSKRDIKTQAMAQTGDYRSLK